MRFLDCGRHLGRTVCAASVLLVSLPALADDDPTDNPATELGVVAMPGGQRVGYAETLPAKTFGVVLTAGGGYRSGLLAPAHKMKRAIGNVGLAYAATPWLSLGLQFDGRYDTHKGGGTLTDNGWVGDPRLVVRAARQAGTGMSFGGELQLAAPGSNAPSLVPSALSVEARGLVTIQRGALKFGAAAGFRLDNSAKSIDNAAALSLADQSSLGVSDWHAAVAGVRGAYSAGKVFFGVEAEGKLFVGSDAPSPTVYVGANAGFRLTKTIDLTLFAATNIIKKPTITANSIPLQPYDPAIVGGLSLAMRFGGVKVVSAPLPPPPEPVEPLPPVIEYASLSGMVINDVGAAVPGATVTVTAGDEVRELVTDDSGSYSTDKLPLGDATVTITPPGKSPISKTVALVAGANEVEQTKLAPDALPTRISGTVRTLRGVGVVATVTVAPGELTTTADADGEFELDLPAGGDFEVTVSAPGFASQTRTVKVTKGSTLLYNFELRAK